MTSDEIGRIPSLLDAYQALSGCIERLEAAVGLDGWTPEANIARAESPANYASLQIQPDGTCVERMVVDGQIIGERRLDSVPEDWPL